MNQDKAAATLTADLLMEAIELFKKTKSYGYKEYEQALKQRKEFKDKQRSKCWQKRQVIK